MIFRRKFRVVSIITTTNCQIMLKNNYDYQSILILILIQNNLIDIGIYFSLGDNSDEARVS